MAVTMKQMSLILGALSVSSLVFSVIAENKKPASDLALAFGFLLVAYSVAGELSLFYPYKRRSIPRCAIFKSTTLFVFSLIALCSVVLSAAMLLWPTITEHKHLLSNVHYTTSFIVFFLIAL